MVGVGENRRRSHTIVECDFCKNEFPKPTKRIQKTIKHFCSPECRTTGSRQPRITCNCATCGKQFERELDRQNTKSGLFFCSRKCKDLGQSHQFGLISCGVTTTGTAIDYRALALANYENCCHWCRDTFGELLDVHHIDHNRKNHNLSNLMILCAYCHGLETRRIVTVGKDRGIIILKKDLRTAISKWFTQRGISLESIESKCEPSLRPESMKLSRGLNEEQINKLRQLVLEKPLYEIATQFNAGRSTVRGWCLKYGIERPPLGYWYKKRYGSVA